MSQTFDDNVARLHDVEALLCTAEGLLARQSGELDLARCQLRETILALQAARQQLIERWRQDEA